MTPAEEQALVDELDNAIDASLAQHKAELDEVPGCVRSVLEHRLLRDRRHHERVLAAINAALESSR